VEAVSEELHPADAREPRVPQNPLRYGVAEGRSQQDSVVDLDVEVVHREGKVVGRGERESPAQVHGGLFLQGLRAEDLRRSVVHREVADLHELDRKSTRLNSSHLVISYAVFCLKKKKQKYELPT